MLLTRNTQRIPSAHTHTKTSYIQSQQPNAYKHLQTYSPRPSYTYTTTHRPTHIQRITPATAMSAPRVPVSPPAQGDLRPARAAPVPGTRRVTQAAAAGAGRPTARKTEGRSCRAAGRELDLELPERPAAAADDSDARARQGEVGGGGGASQHPRLQPERPRAGVLALGPLPQPAAALNSTDAGKGSGGKGGGRSSIHGCSRSGPAAGWCT